MFSAIDAVPPLTLDALCAWENLLLAWRKAARGKRGRGATAAFEHQVADRLLRLQGALAAGTYRPGPYEHFFIHEPKRRRISAAPFPDRVVHHALCNILEPHFEARFMPTSYANRLGMGTHRAVDRVQELARAYPYALRMDVVQHFASIDHRILSRILGRLIRDPPLLALVQLILAGGDRVLEQEYRMVWFPGDDLFAACRPRGLPIGNLTSQFWSNCYLHSFDQFVSRELQCPAYVRYVDDLILFAPDKVTLWDWKRHCIARLARLRLTIHESQAQVQPVVTGIPWLGFEVFPDHRRVKGRKVRAATKHLEHRFADWRAGRISFAAFDASIQGWIGHVSHADSWWLRDRVLQRFVW